MRLIVNSATLLVTNAFHNESDSSFVRKILVLLCHGALIFEMVMPELLIRRCLNGEEAKLEGLVSQ